MTGTLDSNSGGAVSSILTVTTETLFTLYIFSLTGTHKNTEITLEFSPDNGTSWIEDSHSMLGIGCESFSAACTRVRVKVKKAEGDTSTATYHLLSR